MQIKHRQNELTFEKMIRMSNQGFFIPVRQQNDRYRVDKGGEITAALLKPGPKIRHRQHNTQVFPDSPGHERGENSSPHLKTLTIHVVKPGS